MSSHTDTRYDAVVIGTGQGGKPLSLALAQAGMKTAVIERGPVGGSCINVGCTPTKTMVASARVAYLARRGADYGVHHGAVHVRLSEVLLRKRQIVERFRNGSRDQLLSTEGLDLIEGEAAFTGARSLEVSFPDGKTKELTAERIFINTGTRAAQPPIEGLSDVPALDNASVMELDALPEHLMILGGGYIGLEFGQMYRRFGSRVTIVQRGEHLLSREDADVSDEVASILREDGIELLLNAAVSSVGGDTGSLEVEVTDPKGTRSVSGTHLLIAAGRVPNTDRLNLDAAGIETDDRGFVLVNERLETNVPGVYGVGDVKGGPGFTHISYDDFRILRTNLLQGGNANTRGRLLPYTVFIDPQLGRVGLSETEARTQGRNIRVAKLPMTHVARALEMDETRGFMKAVVDADTHLILGASVLGVEGGEVAAVFQMAMMGKVSYTDIKDAVFSHPTLAESLNNLFMAMDR